MIASGEKKEEYRMIKSYWECRLIGNYWKLKWEFEDNGGGIVYYEEFDTVTFRNGYGKNAPEMVVECKGIDNWPGDVFRIHLGEIISSCG